MPVDDCDKTPVCVTCAYPPHVETPCARTLCANCSGAHPSSSKTCPKFIQMKEIITIKTDRKCTIREAINIHKQQIPQKINDNSTSFSEMVQQPQNMQKVNSPINNTTVNPNSNAISNNSNPTSNISTDNTIKKTDNSITNNNAITNSTPESNATNIVAPNSTCSQATTRMLVEDFISQIYSPSHNIFSLPTLLTNPSHSNLPSNSSQSSLTSNPSQPNIHTNSSQFSPTSNSSQPNLFSFTATPSLPTTNSSDTQ